jgi:hypothetical protein
MECFAFITGGAPPTEVGGPKKLLRLKEQKETVATSRDASKHPTGCSKKAPDKIGGLL